MVLGKEGTRVVTTPAHSREWGLQLCLVFIWTVPGPRQRFLMHSPSQHKGQVDSEPKHGAVKSEVQSLEPRKNLFEFSFVTASDCITTHNESVF